MKYPSDFPEHLQRSVDKAIAEAEIAFNNNTGSSWSSLNLAIGVWVECIYFAFGKQVCAAVRQRIWTGEIARARMAEFLHTMVVTAYFEKQTERHGFDNFEEQLKRLIRSSPEWVGFQRSLADALSYDPPPPATDLPVLAANQSPQKTRHLKEPNAALLQDPDASLNRLKACEALGITSRTLDRWVADGKLTPIGLGARKRFRVKEVKRLLQQKLLDKRDTK
jgi:hypothetical protein